MIRLIIYYLTIFFLFSILGRLGEFLAYPIIKKSVIKRGFLRGPWCPIYGFGAIIVILIIKTTNNIITFTLLSTIIFSIIEYETSYLLERIFNKKWWDYSKYKFNLNGRIALIYTISFGLYAVIFRQFVYPNIFIWINMININILSMWLWFILIVFLIDVVFSVLKCLKDKS